MVPLLAGRSSQLFSLSRVALYAVVGLSVVVLTGWAGQLSLGQFAVVGIGTFGAAALEAHGVPFWVTVPLAGLLGAGVSFLVGVPALRARGLDLAVTTLALAVACSSWLFTQSWLLQSGGVALVNRGRLLGLDLRGPLAYYEVCVACLAAALVAVVALRRSDLGRRLLAVRSNERRAAAAGVSPAWSKLWAFAVAGVLAGVAGALLAGLRVRSGPTDFGPDESLQVVALAVIGGAGSAVGAVVGAVFVLGVPAIFGDTTVAGLLPSGIGLLVLVLAFPGGLVELGTRAWGLLPGVGRIPGADGIRGLLAPARRRPVAPEGIATPPPATPPPATPPPATPPPATPPPATRPSLAATAVPFGRGRGRPSALIGSRVSASLVVSGLTVRFGGRVALDDVGLSVAAGEVLGLIGANGAGKSTLLDVVSGFIAPDAGRVVVADRDLAGLSPAQRARVGIGRVLQDARLFDDLVLAEAVMVGASAFGGDRARRAAEAVDLLGLGPYSDVPCQRLSTGTRRLAELACAIAGDPSLLLLDEPTAGLAQREAEAFGPLLSRLRAELGVTVVLVEHDVPLVVSVADRLVCLGAGSVIASGAPDDVVRDPDVVRSFLGGDWRAIRRSGA